MLRRLQNHMLRKLRPFALFTHTIKRLGPTLLPVHVNPILYRPRRMSQKHRQITLPPIFAQRQKTHPIRRANDERPLRIAGASRRNFIRVRLRRLVTNAFHTSIIRSLMPTSSAHSHITIPFVCSTIRSGSFDTMNPPLYQFRCSCGSRFRSIDDLPIPSPTNRGHVRITSRGD